MPRAFQNYYRKNEKSFSQTINRDSDRFYNAHFYCSLTKMLNKIKKNKKVLPISEIIANIKK
jgi:hypothetical protein